MSVLEVARRLAAWWRRYALALALSLPLACSWIELASAQRDLDQPVPSYTDKRYLRWRNFWEARAYPLNSIPAHAYHDALKQRDAQIEQLSASRPAESIDFGSWTSIGPIQIDKTPIDSGRVTTLAIDPTNPQILYAGAAQGGVWKTTNGGTNWTALTDKECSLAMGSIALDPVNPQVVFAGTGELNWSDSYYGCGVLRSTNGGTTWTRVGAADFDLPTGGAMISKVIIDRATAGGALASLSVLVGSDLGLYRSTDGGDTWSLRLNGIITDLVQDPSNNTVMYAAVGNRAGAAANGIYKSTDSGANWTLLAGGLPTTNLGRISLAIAPSQSSTIFAAIQNSAAGAGFGNLLGLYKSSNSGTNWSTVTATGAGCANQCWYDMVIQVHPTDPQTLYFGGVRLFKSTDGGATFTQTGQNFLHADQHAITFHPTNPSIVFVGNDGGVFKTSDGGTNWFTLNTTLAITQFYASLSPFPTISSMVLGGTQDNHTLFYDGSVWRPVTFQNQSACDGGGTLIDWSDSNINYAQCQWGPGNSFSGPRRSDAGPTGTFVRKVNGINTSDRGPFIPKIRQSRTHFSTIYFGTFRLYRSTNMGEQWSAISGDLTSGGVLSTFEAAPTNDQVIYVGTTDGRFWHTENGGTTWNDRRTGLPNRFITDVEIHPTTPATALVAVSGFGSGHVWRTTSAGAGWTNISGNLPDIPVNALVIDPTAPDAHYYAATDVGVYRTTDGGTTWSPFNNGMPNTAVFDIVYNPTTNVLLAATHGRGVFMGSTAGNQSFMSVTPSAALISSGPVGGGFVPFSQSYTVQNSGPGGVMSWRVFSTDPTVARVSINGGSLNSGQTATVTVSISPDSQDFGAGTYSADIIFINQTNGAGSATRKVSLTVGNNPPGNDNLANAPLILGSFGTITGANTLATRQTGEPTHFIGSTGNKSVWWRWTAPATGQMTIDLAGSSFDTVLSVYAGSQASISSLTQIASNDDYQGARQSRLSFHAVQGTQYFFAVDGFGPADYGFIGASYGLSTSQANVPTVSSILPYARSVQVGSLATAFANIVNPSSTTLLGCSLQMAHDQNVPGEFRYQTTNSANQLTGFVNGPVGILPGTTQNFVLGFRPSAPFAAVDLRIVFDCESAMPASVYSGVNTFLLSASSTPVPDLVAVGSTAPTPGILDIPGASGAAAFAAAAVNIGAAGTITATADTNGVALPLTLSLCQTNPTSGACINPTTPSPSASMSVSANQTITIAVFAQASGAISLDAATKRVFLRLASGGVTRGATSVAVRTLGPPPQ